MPVEVKIWVVVWVLAGNSLGRRQSAAAICGGNLLNPDILSDPNNPLEHSRNQTKHRGRATLINPCGFRTAPAKLPTHSATHYANEKTKPSQSQKDVYGALHLGSCPKLEASYMRFPALEYN